MDWMHKLRSLRVRWSAVFVVGSMLAGCEALAGHASQAMLARCEQDLFQEALTEIMESMPEGEKKRFVLEKLNDNEELERVRSMATPLRGVSTPQYQGLVTPVRQLIVLRIRPFPQSTLTMEQKVSYVEKSESLGAVWGGTVLAQPLDNSIEATMAIGNYESWKNDKLVSRELEKMRMNLLVSERGELLDFSSSGSFGSVSKGNLKDIGMGFEQIKELLKAIFPTLPKQGVVTGDKVSELNVSLVVPHFFVISMSMDAIVQGSTQYNERPSLVVDLSGFAKMGLNCIPMHGYGLLDIETAILTHYDVILGVRMRFGKMPPAIWKYHEVLQVDLK